MHREYLTPENKEFIQEIIDDRYPRPDIGLGTPKSESPLKVEPIEPTTENWVRGKRRTGILAKKIGVYPMWTKEGKKISTTLLQVKYSNTK